MEKPEMQEVYYGCYLIRGGFVIKKAYTSKLSAWFYLLRNKSNREDYIRGWIEHGYENKKEHFYD